MIEIPFDAAAGGEQEFAYIVSHDLRASARALSELPVWIRDDLAEHDITIPDDVAESIDLLQRHGRRLDQMLVDLLSYSRAGTRGPVEAVELAPVVEQARQALALPPGVTLTADDVEGVVHMARDDAHRLVHALLDNAARHGCGAQGQIDLSARVLGENVHLVIEDNGQGIAPDQVQKAFKPMTTGQRRDEVEGSGLGLAIVRKIVARANGTLSAGQSERLGGLRIEICCPALADEAVA